MAITHILLELGILTIILTFPQNGYTIDSSEWTCTNSLFSGTVCKTDSLTAATNYSILATGHPSQTTLTIECLDRQRPSVLVPENISKYFTSKILCFNGCVFETVQREMFKSFTDVTEVRLYSNNITEIGQGTFNVFPKLKKLQMYGNNLGVLQSGTFHNIRRLWKLELRKCAIAHIEPGVFNLRMLHTLDLRYNLLTAINSTEFHGLENLIALNLQYNLIKVVENNPFGHMRDLHYLRLHWNKITYIAPDTFTNLHHISKIMLYGNKLEKIYNGTFVCLPYVKEISLWNNSLTHMQPFSFHSPNETCYAKLRSLGLEYNNLTLVPGVFKMDSLALVEDLDISHNKLVEVSSFAFFGMRHLRTLCLSKNVITRLTRKAFYGMLLLSELDLSHNLIEYIPTELVQGNSLKFLHLNNNRLKRLDNAFLNSPLFFLNLSNNAISYIGYGANGDLLQAETLDLSDNQLAVFPTVNIGPLFLIQFNIIYTKHLYLQRNRIVWWPSRVSFITRLTIIDLSDNYLKYVSDMFRDLEKLTLVNLKNNSIGSLHKGTLRISENPNVKRPQVLLGGNPLKCDCNMEWILDSASDHHLANIGDLYQMTCDHVTPETGVRHQTQIVDVPRKHFLCQMDVVCEAECHCYYGDEDCASPCPENCNCYISTDHAVTYLVCSGNYSKVESVLKPGTNVFIMDGNNVTTLSENSFVNATSTLQNVSIARNQIYDIIPGTFLLLGSLTCLNLQFNLLTEIYDYTFEGLTSLTHLNLQNNQLVQLSGLELLPSLEVLQLDHNQIQTFCFQCFNTSFHLHSMFLKGNLWYCDCEFGREFQKWMASTGTLVRDSTELYCASGTKYSGYKAVDVDFKECNVKTEFETDFALAIILSGFFIVIIILFIVGYKYKEFIRVILYNNCGVRIGDALTGFNKKYDAFLSYSKKDSKYVRTLFEELEKNPPYYKLCFHHRDWLIGPPIAENIIDSVANCRRTILLISQNFLDSEWCYLEFQAAHNQFIRDKTTRPIVIILEDRVPHVKDTELQYYIETHTYLKWNDPWFWQKLRYAMPDRGRIQDNGIELDVTGDHIHGNGIEIKLAEDEQPGNV